MSCDDCTCKKSICLRNPAAKVASTTEHSDLEAVTTLPETWEPKRGGPILANYLKEREEKHEGIHKDILEKAAKENKEIDDKVRTLAETLLLHIQQNQSDINCVVDHCGSFEVPITKESRDEAVEKINKLNTERVDYIATFKKEALALEKLRAEKISLILRDDFQRLVKVGHMTPKDLLHDFDERIYGINQQLLSNSKAYVELEAKLCAQGDEAMIKARSELNQLCLGVTIAHRPRSAFHRPRDEKRMSHRHILSADDRRSSGPSLRKMIGGVEYFEQCVNHLVEAYRNAVMKVFIDFSGKLDDLHVDIGHYNIFGQRDLMTQNYDLQNMIDKALNSLAEQVLIKSVVRDVSSEDISGVTHSEAMLMQKSLWALGEKLRHTYRILHDAGHLWDAHIIRSALAQTLTIAAVEDLLTSNDNIQLAQEVNFNIGLEQLQNCSDEDKLQKIYADLVNMLERIHEMYSQHNKAEIARLEEFLTLPMGMANTLLAEIHCFLEKYPRQHHHSASYPQTPYRSSSLDAPLKIDPTVPRLIIQTELQGSVLLNWRNGFLESIESNMSLVPEELNHQANIWVKERMVALHTRHALKMTSHNIRMDRLKSARDIRLAEIRHHDERLSAHIDAVYNLLESLPIDATNFLSLDSAQLYPFIKWVTLIQDNLESLLAINPSDPEVRRLKMSSYWPRLHKYRRLFEDSLDQAIAVSKKEVEHHIQSVRISNVRYMSDIKMSSEDGCYAVGEALRTLGVLMKASDTIELCYNKTVEALNRRRGEILAQADQMLAPLFKVLDDELRGGKGGKAQDKKKAGDAGKKKK